MWFLCDYFSSGRPGQTSGLHSTRNSPSPREVRARTQNRNLYHCVVNQPPAAQGFDRNPWSQQGETLLSEKSYGPHKPSWCFPSLFLFFFIPVSHVALQLLYPNRIFQAVQESQELHSVLSFISLTWLKILCSTGKKPNYPKNPHTFIPEQLIID